MCQTDIKQDKLVHFTAGALISGLSYGPIFNHTKSAPKALFYSTACAFLAGTAKELYDAKRGKTGFGTEDLVVTAFGGFVASSFITISIKDRGKRKQIEKIKKEEQLPKDVPSDLRITDLGGISKE